ncbi:MAG: protein kinase [Candidatus Glassbacteria bacterium]
MICPNCRTENPNSNWYCLNCGVSLRETPGKPSAARGKPARPEADSPQAKDVFAGRYSNLVKIGDGAMAAVYRAQDTELDQTVALKVLKPDLAANREYIARFKREIALARTITHPNVYRIYDIGLADGVHFISMEFIDGQELKKVVTAGKLSLEEAVGIVRQICRALSEAHAKGIVHRDLKPQNIMVEKLTGRCVVMDFGIAIGETSSAITQTGAFIGTPEYISPEQANGQPVDQTSDIYSLGIIMYEIFTGKLPFGPGKPLAVALQHVNEVPVAPRKVVRSIPRELEKVILRAIHKDPRKRYCDAASLLADLDAIFAPADSIAEKPSGKAAIAHTSRNPYLNRTMIRDRNYFFGRKKEVATIFSRIGAARPQSVSVVGERRIGKSSLLNFINQEGNRISHLDDSTSYVFIFMDFQEKRRSSVEEFFTSLFEALAGEAGEKLTSLPAPGYDGFKEVCEKLDYQKMKLILLFDEFESITKNKNFSPEFFAFLRSLANNYNVAYVTSSVKNLQELCHNREISDSPFFNIFSNLNLGAFTEEEAQQFVREPSRACGNPLEEHFETVVELAGYFPFYMAIACSILFDFDFERADPKKPVLENVEELFIEEAGMHFQFILDSLSAEERLVCQRIAGQQPISSIDRYLLKGLLRRGYFIPGEQDQEVRVFSRAFERMLAEYLAKQKIS